VAILEIGVSHYLPVLALKLNPPNLSLPSILNYRCEPLASGLADCLNDFILSGVECTPGSVGRKDAITTKMAVIMSNWIPIKL
jgi:hypothetical protein